VRLVCLSAESADICARLGAWEDVVAVSAFASQEGLEHRPVIGGFSHTDDARILAAAPDLVITFSDVQAEITARLVRAGCAVLATNQRTLAEITQTIRVIGGAIGRERAATELAAQFTRELSDLDTDRHPQPRVYFEEWPEPLISGIGWVGEIIELCGGIDVFATRRGRSSRERVVSSEEIVAANPDVILASWCGRRVDLDKIRRRPGFSSIKAVQGNALQAIDSDLLLAPGPRLLEGAREVRRLLDQWSESAGRALAT
jgi:iron complex transport system substrate-binding protein